MNKIIRSDEKTINESEINGQELGTVSVSMYKDTITGLPIFKINTDNENVLQLSYIIEDILNDF